ncbi:MAG: STAS domain-containing protein [Rhodococcus sp. (in: high G+C Gram-positive bacteria)]|uniref:STAS domain-containing protein n=1 Tax=Rhodococcus sp. TaxID=1831 RepID=UPI003BB137E9
MSVVPEPALAFSGGVTGIQCKSRVPLAASDSATTHCTSAGFSSERIGSGVVLVGVRGEIDLCSAPELREYVGARISSESHLILDMSKVDFIGTAGLAVLDTVNSTSLRDGRVWALICGRPVSRLLRAAGRERNYPCFESLDSALGSWHGRTA